MAKAKKQVMSFAEGVARRVEGWREFLVAVERDNVYVEWAGAGRRVADLGREFLRLTESVVAELESEQETVKRLREELAAAESEVEDLKCAAQDHSDEIARVCELAKVVLGREDLDEPLARFELRRAVEDLRDELKLGSFFRCKGYRGMR